MVHRTIIYRPLSYGGRPMPASADDESQRNFILAFVLGLIALVILFVIGIALYSQSHKARTATAAGPATVVAGGTATRAGGVPPRAGNPRGGGTVELCFCPSRRGPP